VDKQPSHGVMKAAAHNFRKKPVVIEAHVLTESNGEWLAAWCGGASRRSAKPSDPTDIAIWLDIPTLEGVMRANLGDWIIKGVKGEFYPCKPDIFVATYEPVEAEMGDERPR
jgi:hypothetical protein